MVGGSAAVALWGSVKLTRLSVAASLRALTFLVGS
jgi:hypothetical protein